MDARGQAVCVLRQRIFAELRSSLTGLTEAPVKNFDAPKILHDERLARYPLDLLRFKRDAEVAFPNSVTEFAHHNASWLTGALYNDDAVGIPREVSDLLCQTVTLAISMYAYWKSLDQIDSQWRAYNSELARHTFNQFWYSLKWSEVYNGSTSPPPPLEQRVGAEIEEFISTHSKLFEGGPKPEISQRASTIELFKNLETCFSSTILKYVHNILSDWKGAQDSVNHIPLALSFQTLFFGEIEGLKRCACRYIISEIDKEFCQASDDRPKKYGIFQIIPTMEHDWLDRLWLNQEHRLQAFELTARWSALTSPYGLRVFINQLKCVGDMVAKCEMEEEVGWTNKDWGTRTAETEAEELKPLISELFPRLCDEDFLEDPVPPEPLLNTPVELNERAALTIGLQAICARGDVKNLQRSLLREILKKSLSIIPIRSFAPNSAEHLASLYSLDLADLCQATIPPDDSLARASLLSSSNLIFTDCDLGECTFHTSGAKPYLLKLTKPLLSIKNSILRLARTYTCGLIPQMSHLLNALNKILSLSLTSSSGSILLHRCDMLWHELVDVWVRNHAKANESFEEEVGILAAVNKDLRQWSIGEWRYICSSRQIKVASKIFAKTSLALLSYAFADYDDYEKHAQSIAQFIEDLFRVPEHGLRVGEVPIFRQFLKNLAQILESDKKLQYLIHRMWQITHGYELIVRQWAREKLAPLHGEILKTQKLAKLGGNHLVERDQKSFQTKYLTIARCVRDMDIHLNTVSGKVIQDWFNQLSVEKKFSLWRPFIEAPIDSPLIPEPTALASSSDSSNHVLKAEPSSHIEIFGRITEDFEDLLTQHTQSYVMRLLKNVRTNISALIPESSWRHYKRIDGQRWAADSLVLKPSLDDRFQKMLRSCVEFFGLEESVCDPEFIRACDWYSILTNFLIHHEDFVRLNERVLERSSIVETALRINSNRQVKELNCAIAVLKPVFFEKAKEHLDDARKCISALMLVTEIQPINVKDIEGAASKTRNALETLLESFNIFDERESVLLSGPQPLAEGEEQSLTPTEPVLLADYGRLVDGVKGCSYRLSEIRKPLDVFMTLNGLDDRTRKKLRRKLKALGSSMADMLACLRSSRPLNLTELAKILDLDELLLAAEKEVLKVDLTPDWETTESSLESKKLAEENLNAFCHLIVTISTVCSHLARNGMNYLAKEDPAEEPQVGDDEFVQGEGLADGSGMQQAGEELENELDFDTLADAQKDDNDKQEAKSKGEETAQDVEMDFEGELEDLPSDGLPEEEEAKKDCEERFDQVDDGDVENLDLETAQDLSDGENEQPLREAEETPEGLDQDGGVTEDALAAMDNDNLDDEDGRKADSDDTDEQTAESAMEDAEDAADDQEAAPEDAAGDLEGEPDELADMADGDGETPDRSLDVDELLDESNASEDNCSSAEGDEEAVSDREEPVDDDKGDEQCNFGSEVPTLAHEESEEDEAASEEAQGERTKGLDNDNEADYGGAAEVADDQNQTCADVADNQGSSGPGDGTKDKGGNCDADQGENTAPDQPVETAGGGSAKTQLESNECEAVDRSVRQLVEKAENEHSSPTERPAGTADIDLAELDSGAEDKAMAFGEVDEISPPENGPGVQGQVEHGEKEFENTDDKANSELQHKEEKGKNREAAGEDESDEGDVQMLEASSPEAVARSWREIEALFERKAAQLCESLRTVLVPTNKGRYQGYFRTGKRLDMRQVLSFIASDYRKDRIWLRRNRISKRNYEIILAIDNSASMKALNVHNEAIDAMIVISMALKRLEVGKIGIVKFGNEPGGGGTRKGGGSEFVLADTDVLSIEKGQQILTNHLTFSSSMPDGFNQTIPDLLDFLCAHFESSESTTINSRRLVMILTDGRFNQNGLQPLLDRLLSLQVCPVLLFIDPKNTIYDLKLPVLLKTNTGRPSVMMKNWLDPNALPFKSYAVLNDIEKIDSTLCNIVREWLSRLG